MLSHPSPFVAEPNKWFFLSLLQKGMVAVLFLALHCLPSFLSKDRHCEWMLYFILVGWCTLQNWPSSCPVWRPQNHRICQVGRKGLARITELNSWPCTATSPRITPCAWKHWRNSSWALSGLEHCPGEPVRVPKHHLDEEPFSNIQLKPLLTQLQAVALAPITVTTEKTSLSAPPPPFTKKL